MDNKKLVKNGVGLWIRSQCFRNVDGEYEGCSGTIEVSDLLGCSLFR